MTSPGSHADRVWAAGILLALALLAFLPLLAPRDDVLNFAFLVLLSITLAQSWNIIAGYAGQVNLGHAAFFGLGALTARTLWIAGTPVLVAMAAGALVAPAFALLVGAAAFRLRGAYFAIGTLALGEILRTTVGNVLPEISTLPAPSIAAYRLAPRYYLALALAALSVIAVATLARSRLGLGMIKAEHPVLVECEDDGLTHFVGRNQDPAQGIVDWRDFGADHLTRSGDPALQRAEDAVVDVAIFPMAPETEMARGYEQVGQDARILQLTMIVNRDPQFNLRGQTRSSTKGRSSRS